MNDALISVIIPVYNVENYLETCMESVTRQSYTNLQIIVVDDGATDNSGMMCDEWAKRDSRICVIHQENGGLSAARNHAIEYVKGEYIAFLDSDDIYHKDFIKLLYLAICTNDADIAQCGIERFADGSRPKVKVITEPCKSECLDATGMNKRIYTSGVIDYTVVWNKLYKKNIFEEIRFLQNRLHEDTFMTFKLYYLAKKIAVIPEKLYCYRYRKNSIMTTKVSMRNLDMLDAFDTRLDFYNKVKDEELYNLCLERYMFSAVALYYRAMKSDANVLAEIFNRAKIVYNKMQENREVYSSTKMKEYNLFIKNPKIYCYLKKIFDLAKKIINKIFHK